VGIRLGFLPLKEFFFVIPAPACAGVNSGGNPVLKVSSEGGAFVLKYCMLNLIVISPRSEEIYSMFKSGGFSPGGLEDLQGDESYDLLFLDLETENWREKIVQFRQKMPVVAFGSPDIRTAVDAMRLGATDYIEQPLTAEKLQYILERHKKKILNRKHGFDEIMGVSLPMQEVFGLIKRAAASESNVLVTGESGTGKELLARAIHRWSPRKEKTFTTINCSAIPDTLLESELFGFEKGAFTGANYTKKGLLEVADGGTVFFDEIGDVSPLFQIKILRVLQEGEIMRIGGSRPLKVDVRIIAATNKNLKLACQRDAFREDLFYRLNVINIHLPPLRERMEDMRLLVSHFIEKQGSKRKDLLVKGITDEALKTLSSYSFPGNVRELENIIERAISFAGGPDIVPGDLPAYILDSHAASGAHSLSKYSVTRLRDAVTQCEREAIITALKEAGGNISRAAGLLGIYRQQLQRKLRKLKIAANNYTSI
jgi:DNA-binding NtrC family response regulator